LTPPPPPRPPVRYEVEKVELIIDVKGQTASALLRHTVRNTGQQAIELDYLAPLPLGGKVSGLSLVRGGQELPGQIYDKDEAFKIYKIIVAQLRDPALIEYAGRGLYRARVFPLEPGKPVSLELRMEWLLPKDEGRADIVFPLAGPLTQGRVVPFQEVTVTIRGEGVSGAYSPIDGVEISGSKGLSQASLALSGQPPLSSFQLYYQLDPGPVGGLVLSHKPESDDDGYFLFLAEPAIETGEEPVPKTVVFVLDRSGSMIGDKFKQAIGALNFILTRLSNDDSFNLIDFSTDVSYFSPELSAMDDQSRKRAQDYVANLRAGGGTNLSGAMEAALRQTSSGKPTYVIVLTDGLPTQGVTDEAQIVKAAAAANPKGQARLFTFGVGYDVNARLLATLSEGGGGAATFVAEGESIETGVASFFSKISSPVLTKPSLSFNVPTNRLIPATLSDLFQGSQTVVAGRYPKGGSAVATLKGEARRGQMVFTYKTDLASGPSEGGDFVARLWAEKRVASLVEELDSLGGPGPDSPAGRELVKEIVDLAKKHGILSPYTSFLSLEEQSLTDGNVLRQTQQNLASLGQLTGESANRQRQWRSSIVGGVESNIAIPAPMSMDQAQRYKSEAADTDQAVAASSGRLIPPRNLAGRAFFLKNGRLIEGDLSEAELSKAKNVKKLSDEWFQLAQELGSEGAVLLAQAEPIVFRHKGASYLVESD
jgi:Ca-activated chloride channel family protein